MEGYSLCKNLIQGLNWTNIALLSDISLFYKLEYSEIRPSPLNTQSSSPRCQSNAELTVGDIDRISLPHEYWKIELCSFRNCKISFISLRSLSISSSQHDTVLPQTTRGKNIFTRACYRAPPTSAFNFFPFSPFPLHNCTEDLQQQKEGKGRR